MKKLLFGLAIVAAVGTATTTHAVTPRVTYYYFDTAWHVFPGMACFPGTYVNCYRSVNGISQAIYKSQNMFDHLLYNP